MRAPTIPLSALIVAYCRGKGARGEPVGSDAIRERFEPAYGRRPVERAVNAALETKEIPEVFARATDARPRR